MRSFTWNVGMPFGNERAESVILARSNGVRDRRGSHASLGVVPWSRDGHPELPRTDGKPSRQLVRLTSDVPGALLHPSGCHFPVGREGLIAASTCTASDRRDHGLNPMEKGFPEGL